MNIPKTIRLTFRPLALSDETRLVHLCNDKTLIRNTSRLPYPYTADHARSFLVRSIDRSQTEECRFAVCENSHFIACIGATPGSENAFEIGYWVGRENRGRGIATEMVSAFSAWLLDTQEAKTITAGYFVDNPASGAVMAKCGFRETGERIMTHSLGRGTSVETIRTHLTRAAFTPVHGRNSSLS